MKKLLTVALILLSAVGTDALAYRRGRCCPPKCDPCPPCPPKRCPKPCKKESWVVDKFGYLEQTCELPNPQTYRPGFSPVECEVICYKNPCGGCFDRGDAEADLSDRGFKVIDKQNLDSAIATAAQRHAVMGN